MEKQTPRTPQLPLWRGNIKEWIKSLSKVLRDLFVKVRNDLDNGAVNFPTIGIAGIGNAEVSDFDEGQLRIYKDTDDSDKIYIVVRYGDTLYRVTDAMTSI